MRDDEKTRRWQRVTVPAELEQDRPRALRACLAAVRAAPGDPEVRRRLHAVASRHGAWEELVALLEDEVRAADRAEGVCAFLEELAEVHEGYLDQPLEAMSALERLVRLRPDDVELHDRLARMYDRAGAWAKAAEAFEQVACLAPDARASAALRAAARLYRGHGRPDRAVTAFRAIVARRPSDAEAWRALDELLEEQGRWAELADVRGARAGRAREPGERAALLRAQARALDRAGDVAGAARLMVEAAGVAPEDLASLLEHADVLARTGRGREAAALLEARVAEAIAAGAPAEQIAALRFRLAELLDEACADPAAAEAALEALLGASPGHLPALERLVRLAARTGDPRALAAARLRQAAALADGEEKLAALREAARRLREARDLSGAARVLEEACALAPDDAEARRELEVVRAGLLVERAAAEVRAGDVASAEKRLRAVLAGRPHDADANLALAGLLADLGRPADAAAHLRGALAEVPDDVPPEEVARLVHRYATLLAALGEADEAHQLLHEAHRLDRRDLRITLALGESCFSRRLWREAALHLGSLADHPDSSRHAADVAAALVRAAQAETRALRPAVAEKRYEQAVRLDPGCAAAWHALAELATERGDLARAADCLEREAAATAEPRDRVRLWDALGDLALEVLGQPDRAERCFRQAVAAAAPLDERHVPLLEKLLGLERRSNVGAARGETCERLAGLHPDAAVRKAFLAEAVDAFAAAGEPARARAAAERLVEGHPLDEAAVWRASELALAAGDHDRAAGCLGRALAAWDAAGDRGDGDPRRAELWRRLGDARRARGDRRGAEAAYGRAIAAAPDADGALAARRGLAELGPALGRPVVEHLRALVEADPAPADVIALARELARAAEIGAASAEDARAVFELAAALGVALADEDEAFLARNPARVMASDEAYAAALLETEARALAADEDDGPLADALEALWEAAALLCPDPRGALAAAGLADAERVSPVSPAAAAALYPQIARALAGPTTLLYASRRDEHDLVVLLASPPVVVLGPRLASRRARSRSDADVLADAELRFRLGRVVELARPRRVFAAGAGGVAFARLVGGLWRAFGGAAAGAGTVDPAVAAEAERLRTALPVRARTRLAERFAAVAAEELDPMRYLAACERAADRAGLVACGHVGVAVELAGGPGAARHLVRLAAQGRYLDARRRLRGFALH